MLQAIKNFKKKRVVKKHRTLNLDEKTWTMIGEIYTKVLIEEEFSATNEELVAIAIESMHRSLFKDKF